MPPLGSLSGASPPLEVAPVVSPLASDRRARPIQRVCIPVDSGYTARCLVAVQPHRRAPLQTTPDIPTGGIDPNISRYNGPPPSVTIPSCVQLIAVRNKNYCINYLSKLVGNSENVTRTG